MKRCGWSGGKESHGSMSHRVPGSIGASSYPSKVDKGHPLPGQMGKEKVTAQNMEVVEVAKVLTEGSAIVVLLIACALLYGGLGFCVGIAIGRGIPRQQD